uniref:Uncharacterized protein n=1 Tax=Sus scrofa TaxID=9823 RepID=A0A4X1SJQ5_PIG
RGSAQRHLVHIIFSKNGGGLSLFYFSKCTPTFLGDNLIRKIRIQNKKDLVTVKHTKVAAAAMAIFTVNSGVSHRVSKQWDFSTFLLIWYVVPLIRFWSNSPCLPSLWFLGGLAPAPSWPMCKALVREVQKPSLPGSHWSQLPGRANTEPGIQPVLNESLPASFAWQSNKVFNGRIQLSVSIFTLFHIHNQPARVGLRATDDIPKKIKKKSREEEFSYGKLLLQPFYIWILMLGWLGVYG